MLGPIGASECRDFWLDGRESERHLPLEVSGDGTEHSGKYKDVSDFLS